MTPQERQLIDELFDRLAALESNPRDPDAERDDPRGPAPRAERRLCAGADRAGAGRGAQSRQRPHPGLRAGDRRAAAAAASSRAASSTTCATALFGRDEPRGSVPRVPQGGGARWARRRRSVGPAARAAISRAATSRAARRCRRRRIRRRRLVPRHRGSGCGRHDRRLAADGRHPLGDRRAFGRQPVFAARSIHCAAAASGTPWGGNAAGSDSSREAGLDDIGGRRLGRRRRSQRAGLFDTAQNDMTTPMTAATMRRRRRRRRGQRYEA